MEAGAEEVRGLDGAGAEGEVEAAVVGGVAGHHGVGMADEVEGVKRVGCLLEARVNTQSQ